MLRLYQKNDNALYKDFENKLFHRNNLGFDFPNDQVTIEGVAYELSSINNITDEYNPDAVVKPDKITQLPANTPDHKLTIGSLGASGQIHVHYVLTRGEKVQSGVVKVVHSANEVDPYPLDDFHYVKGEPGVKFENVSVLGELIQLGISIDASDANNVEMKYRLETV